MVNVLITGGSGFVGKELTSHLLSKGYDITVLGRSNKKQQLLPSYVKMAPWDPAKKIIDEKAIKSADHIIQLAGANVGEKKWTNERKQEILKSRVDAATCLAESLKNIPNKVKSVIAASAIGWYGPDPLVPNPKPFIETDVSSRDFLGDTCRLAEQSIAPVAASVSRLIILRTGIVLGRNGGMVKRFILPLKFGIAPVLGKGNQYYSWIYIKDLVRIYEKAIEDKSMVGVYNAVAPKAITQKDFVKTLARNRKKFFIPFRVPSFLLRLLYGEISIEVLKSATVSSERLKASGFEFEYGDIGAATKLLFAREPAADHPVNA